MVTDPSIDTSPDQRSFDELISSCQEWHGLPQPFYHDEALYRHEVTTIWRGGWVFVGHTCQIPRVGDYFTMTLDSDPLIIISDDNGAVRAFHNICTHRGTLLCPQETGHARLIACPYHQWTFSSRGDLLSCKGMQDGIDRSALGLHPIHLEICAGLIFVSLADTPPAFAPACDLIAHFAHPQGFEQARVAKIIDYQVPANWKIVWENNRECYHCTVNHPEYSKSNFDIFEEGHSSDRSRQRLEQALARSQAALNQDTGLAITHREGGLAAFPDALHNIWYSANRTVLVDGYESESLDGRRVAPLMGSYRDASAGILRMRTLPNFWSHSSCDHAVSTRLLPGGLYSTHVRVFWLVHQDAREGIDYHLDALLPFWQLTSEQNWELCARVQRGVSSSAYRPGPLSQRREYNLEAFLRWYLHQLGHEGSRHNA